LRQPLYQESYIPQFSGHETFPLRYGWLKKVFDRVAETESQPENRLDCWGDDAIARFGVGKNMVASMRHWAKATDVIEEPGNNIVRTKMFGQLLFGPRGLDPFMENPSTLWLIHWKLSNCAARTTWYWAFNHYPSITFERESLINGLYEVKKERQWPRVSYSTIKNDVACFIRTYVAHQPHSKSGGEDTLESPLTELGLIKPISNSGGFRFVRGPKLNLSNGVFAHCLVDYWSRVSKASTLSFESIAHSPGSPGRVFLLDEDDVVDRLSSLEGVTKGALRWIETAGLKQIERKTKFTGLPTDWVTMDYSNIDAYWAI